MANKKDVQRLAKFFGGKIKTVDNNETFPFIGNKQIPATLYLIDFDGPRAGRNAGDMVSFLPRKFNAFLDYRSGSSYVGIFVPRGTKKTLSSFLISLRNEFNKFLREM